MVEKLCSGISSEDLPAFNKSDSSIISQVAIVASNFYHSAHARVLYCEPGIIDTQHFVLVFN